MSLFEVLKSVLSSFMGVQKDATRERDFTYGRPRDFIVVGIMLTAVFVLLVWGLVQLVVAVAMPG
jgi:hypothetical protein